MRILFTLCGLAILSLIGCQPDILVEEPIDQGETIECHFKAVAAANDCGLYIKLENGLRIYTESTRFESVREGDELILEYFLQPSSQSTGDCGAGCGTTSSHTQETDEQTCWERQGIQKAGLTCLTIVSSTPQ